MSIFSFLASLFTSLLSATKNAWNHLPKTVQTGILNGSGIFNIISQYIGQDPKLTIATIQANYPLEDLTLLYTGLAAVLKEWGITAPPDLESAIVAVQTRLKSLDDNNWARVLSGGAQILADVLTGGGTPFEIVVTLIQWVFTNLVKPKQIVFASVDQTNTSQSSGAVSPKVPAQ
jgi:hypothetical protein